MIGLLRDFAEHRDPGVRALGRVRLPIFRLAGLRQEWLTPAIS